MASTLLSQAVKSTVTSLASNKDKISSGISVATVIQTVGSKGHDGLAVFRVL